MITTYKFLVPGLDNEWFFLFWVPTGRKNEGEWYFSTLVAHRQSYGKATTVSVLKKFNSKALWGLNEERTNVRSLNAELNVDVCEALTYVKMNNLDKFVLFKASDLLGFLERGRDEAELFQSIVKITPQGVQNLINKLDQLLNENDESLLEEYTPNQKELEDDGSSCEASSSEEEEEEAHAQKEPDSRWALKARKRNTALLCKADDQEEDSSSSEEEEEKTLKRKRCEEEEEDDLKQLKRLKASIEASLAELKNTASNVWQEQIVPIMVRAINLRPFPLEGYTDVNEMMQRLQELNPTIAMDIELGDGYVVDLEYVFSSKLVYDKDAAFVEELSLSPEHSPMLTPRKDEPSLPPLFTPITALEPICDDDDMQELNEFCDESVWD